MKKCLLCLKRKVGLIDYLIMSKIFVLVLYFFENYHHIFGFCSESLYSLLVIKHDKHMEL